MIRYTVNSRTSLLNMPFYVTSLTVTGNTCNEDILTILDLSSFKLLQSVVIGDHCFKYVSVFSIEGLNWLESVTIGSSSFCLSCSCNSNNYREFYITNCSSLSTLSVGHYSFSDYSVFELTTLPKLKSLSIGTYQSSCNFCYVRDFRAVNLPSLESINIGRDSFKYCHSVRIEGEL